MKNNTTLAKLQERAAKNWEEHLAIKKEISSLLKIEGAKWSLPGEREITNLEKEIKKVDKDFVRKMIFFSGDITSTRIAKVISKVLLA